MRDLVGASLLTGAVLNTIGNDGRGSGAVAAGLVGAVTNAVREGGVAAQAVSLVGGATSAAKVTGLTQQVADAGLLDTIVSWGFCEGARTGCDRT